MITRLEATNFRAFQKATVDMPALTVFLGPNNSGKSALVSALSLLSQTLTSADDAVPLLLNGVWEELGTYSDMVFGNVKDEPMEFTLDFADLSQRLAASTGRLWLKFRYRSKRREVVLDRTRMEMPIGDTAYEAHYVATSDTMVFDSVRGKPLAELLGVKPSAKNAAAIRTHFMLSIPWMLTEKLHMVSDRSIRSARMMVQDLARLEFIGPFRSAPSRTYLFTGERPGRAGKSGENAVHMLVADARGKSRQSSGIAGKVSQWLKQCGVAETLAVRPLTDRHFELRVTHPVTKEEQNFADTGFGCSQVLPVLVAGLRAASPAPQTVAPRIFVVQQPELHLHPRAQAELGEFFANLAAGSLQTVIETHSEHLVLRLQTCVARGILRPKDVGVYYVYASKGGSKEVKRIGMNEMGDFTDDWPEGFFPEALNEARGLAKVRAGL